jgi:DNA-binding response OmpR family regulator
MRVLVAEDESKVAEDVAEALRASGYVAEIANNGEDA